MKLNGNIDSVADFSHLFAGIHIYMYMYTGVYVYVLCVCNLTCMNKCVIYSYRNSSD